MTIRIVNVKTFKDDNVYCGRGSPVGNPFPMENQSLEERDRVCDKYRDWFENQEGINNPQLMTYLSYIEEIAKQGNVNLGCYCAPLRCHCETIKEYLDNRMTLLRQPGGYLDPEIQARRHLRELDKLKLKATKINSKMDNLKYELLELRHKYHGMSCGEIPYHDDIGLDVFTDVYDDALTQIFAETGKDREFDFNREEATERYYDMLVEGVDSEVCTIPDFTGWSKL